MADSEEQKTGSVDLSRRVHDTLLVEGVDSMAPMSLGRLIALGSLWFMVFVVVAVPLTVARVEHTLTSATEADLAELGVPVDQVDVEFAFRDGRVSGDLPYHVSPEMVANRVDHPLLGRLEIVAASGLRGQRGLAEVGSLELNAAFNGERVTIVGEVLTDEQYDAILAAAAFAAPGAELDDQLVVTGLEPAVVGVDQRVADLIYSLEQVQVASQWLVQLTDNSLRVDAGVRNQAVADRLRPVFDELDSVPSTIAITVSDRFERAVARSPATADEVDELGADLQALEAELLASLQFPANNFELNDQARATLDKLVEILAANPDPVIDIIGHTDSSGDATTNRALSQRRANAVRAYLASNGIEIQRLRSRGLGSSRPTDTNQTEEGRANNRRIEFEVLGTFES